jgi:drug/metabolite transporter (DMT)-like permease
VALIILSAFMHAGWNLLARRQKSQGVVFMYRLLLAAAAIGFAPALAAELRLGCMGRVWLYVLGSGVFSAAYCYCLARGYETADFTVVYPLARALPVLMVAMADVVGGARLTGFAWAGLALVAVGVTLAPLPSLGAFSRGHYFNRGTLWVALAALGTVGYTVLDSRGQKLVPPGPQTALIYCYFYFLATFVVYAVIVRVAGRKVAATESGGWSLPVAAALLNFAGYWLVLWVFQAIPQASYVLAFRQTSVIIAVAIAFLVFKEKGKAVRLAAAVLICLGLIAIKFWGK